MVRRPARAGRAPAHVVVVAPVVASAT